MFSSVEHTRHAVAPYSLMNSPALHLAHCSAPAPENLPGLQSVHEAALDPENVPPSHFVHSLLPSSE